MFSCTKEKDDINPLFEKFFGSWIIEEGRLEISISGSVVLIDSNYSYLPKGEVISFTNSDPLYIARGLTYRVFGTIVITGWNIDNDQLIIYQSDHKYEEVNYQFINKNRLEINILRSFGDIESTRNHYYVLLSKDTSPNHLKKLLKK